MVAGQVDGRGRAHRGARRAADQAGPSRLSRSRRVVAAGVLSVTWRRRRLAGEPPYSPCRGVELARYGLFSTANAHPGTAGGSPGGVSGLQGGQTENVGQMVALGAYYRQT